MKSSCIWWWGVEGRTCIVTHKVVYCRGMTRNLLAFAEEYEFLHQPEDAGQCSPRDFPYHCSQGGRASVRVSPPETINQL